MNIQLTDIIDDPTRVEEVSPEEIPDLLGELEMVRARLWGRLNVPFQVSSSPKSREVDQLMTVATVSEKLALNRGYVYELIRQKQIPVVRDGRQIRIKESDLRTWVEEHRENGH